MLRETLSRDGDVVAGDDASETYRIKLYRTRLYWEPRTGTGEGDAEDDPRRESFRLRPRRRRWW